MSTGRPIVAVARRGTDRTGTGEAGTGMLGTASGFLVFLVFLVFAVQVTLGLHARTAVGAVADDAARRAAVPGASVAAVVHEARAALGGLGERAQITVGTADDDHDGAADTVVVTIVAPAPTLVPRSLGGAVGLDAVRRSARARIEQVIA